MSEKRFIKTATERPELDTLVREAVQRGVTNEQLHEQRVSFAYGNAPESPRITKESVREATKSLRLIQP